MTTGVGTIEVLDPTSQRRIDEHALAARPASLDGKVLGLLDNGKPNAALVIDAIAEAIGKQFRLAGIVRISKRYTERISAGPMSDEFRDRLVSECDVVLNATGD